MRRLPPGGPKLGPAVLAVGLAVLFPAPAMAQALEYSLTSATLKMVGVLALVLALLLGLVFLLKKVSPLFGRRAAVGREMDLLAQYPLGPKRFLAVVRVGEQLLLLGVTEANVNLLTEIKDPDVVRRLLDGEAGSGQGFKTLLKKAGQGLKKESGQ